MMARDHTLTGRRCIRTKRWLSQSWLAIVLGVGLAIGGCRADRVPQSNAQEAKALIESTMQQWVAGASLDAQREKDPPVYVADDAWMNGAKLQDFEIIGDGEQVGANVRFRLTLMLMDAKGTVQKREQAYVVTTTPALTVARLD